MNNTLKNTLFLFGGIAIGAIAGILTAPKSGKETREEIMDELSKLKTKVNDLSGKAKTDIEERIEKLTETLAKMEAQVNGKS
jgi:gas vesicle protein